MCPPSRWTRALPTTGSVGRVRAAQNKQTPFCPHSPYGAARMYIVPRNYREVYGLFAVNGILFNRGSPRRGETFGTLECEGAPCIDRPMWPGTSQW